MDPKGKVALVTGASRGIGAATAIALGRAGAEVLLVARTVSDLEQVAAKIRSAGGKAGSFAVDLTDHRAIVATCQRIREAHGTPDILVNNAGAGRWLFVQETPHAEAEMLVRLPYLAAFQMTREWLPGMLERGSGHIVLVNSPACLHPWGGSAGYAASRWALRGLAEALKSDLHGSGIDVSHVIIGEVDSAYWQANPGTRERVPQIAKFIPKSTVEQAAGYILTAIRRRKHEFVRPYRLLLLRWSLWLAPGISKYLIRVGSYRP
ncbi:MAG: SDR family oxidoreductase [Bacteroidota bacterium]